jgi:hypothetical protein
MDAKIELANCWNQIYQRPQMRTVGKKKKVSNPFLPVQRFLESTSAIAIQYFDSTDIYWPSQSYNVLVCLVICEAPWGVFFKRI